MKKLMFVAAVAAAMAGFGQIESGNVVGYLAKSVGSDVYQDQVATFVAPDGSGFGRLGDLIPVSNSDTPLSELNFSIQFVGTDGNQIYVADMVAILEMPDAEDIVADYGDCNAIFAYVPGDDGEPGTWYLDDDKTKRGGRYYPMNNMKIKNGQGYTVYAGSALKAGARMTYSGQVLDKDLPFDVGCDVYDNSGNIAPADMELADFIPSSKDSTALNELNFSIQFVGVDGNQAYVADFGNILEMDEAEDIVADYGDCNVIFAYVPASGADPAHWYLDDDKTKRGGRYYPMDHMKIKAGQGFTLYAGSALKSGASLLLPNALK